MSKPKILVVDDKENMLTLFEKILGSGYELTTADDGARALSLIAARPFDVIVTDIRMPGADGFEILKAVKAHAPETEVVMMTAYASVQKAVKAIKLGAYDYIQKPFDPDDVSLIVARAVERKRLREEAASLRRELEGVYVFDNIVGKTPAMRDVYELVQRAAKLDITVLLAGETGTGKELVARAIHHHSGRRDARFVAVNCGALPTELVESELFGHAKGAFTGAHAPKEGLFEEAAGGTLFLDEIGDLPSTVQVKLNRALQEKVIRRVGATTEVPVDVRVIAASHRDLKDEVQAGRFRQDLFYRLNVFPITLPPLRERREDISLLAAHFLTKYGKVHERALQRFEPEMLRALTTYSWPGNVRELENVIERAVAISDGPTIKVDALPPEVRGTEGAQLPTEVLVKMPYREAVDLARNRVSRDYLVALMRELGGNVTHAAERAGMERESLHRLLKRYGVRSEDFKQKS